MQCSVEKNSLYNDLIQSKQTNKQKKQKQKKKAKIWNAYYAYVLRIAFPCRIKILILRSFVSSV